MEKLLSCSLLLILILSFPLFADGHKYRIMLQGVDYPSGSFEIILNKLMIRASPGLCVSQNSSEINYELGIGFMSIDKTNYSLVPSISYIGTHYRSEDPQSNSFHNADRIGVGLNVAFYWYWNNLLLGGYLPFVTSLIQFENNNGQKITSSFQDIYFNPRILVGVYF